MNRLIIFLLAAVDALVSVAVGIALIIAPLTVLWVFALPGADWAALWRWESKRMPRPSRFRSRHSASPRS
jgi:hypothetical protein